MSNNISILVSLFIIYFNIISNCKGILFHLTLIPDGGMGGYCALCLENLDFLVISEL